MALLPVMAQDDHQRLHLAPERPVRRCSSCYVASSCPAYQPDAQCAYKIPVQLGTRDEMLTFLHGVIEMQGQRVMFGRFIEEAEGGYADPNLSNEIDRLMKLVAQLRDIEDGGSRFRMTVEANERAGAGMLSRIFGSGPAAPQEPTQGALGSGQGGVAVIDAAVVEDGD